MKFGKVTQFIKAQGYGFIRSSKGEDIFFHVEDWKPVVVRDGELGFTDGDIDDPRFRDPKRGDNILFEVKPSGIVRKAMAAVWTFEDDWLSAEYQVSKMKAQKTE